MLRLPAATGRKTNKYAVHLIQHCKNCWTLPKTERGLRSLFGENNVVIVIGTAAFQLLRGEIFTERFIIHIMETRSVNARINARLICIYHLYPRPEKKSWHKWYERSGPTLGLAINAFYITGNKALVSPNYGRPTAAFGAYDLLPSDDIKQQVRTNPLAQNEILCKLGIIPEKPPVRQPHKGVLWLGMWVFLNVRVHMFISGSAPRPHPYTDLVMLFGYRRHRLFQGFVGTTSLGKLTRCYRPESYK